MPQIISMTAKNLCKHVQYISLSSKKWTGIWFSRYGNLDHFISIGRENIDLADRKMFGTSLHSYERKTYKSAASDEYIPGIRQKTQVRRRSLLIMSKSGENTGLQVTDRVILFNLRDDISLRGRRSVAIFF